MRKSIVMPSIIVPLIIAGIIFLKDGWTFLMCSLMALIVIGTIHFNRTHVTKVTRWSKANPHKAQVLITVLQVVIAVLGIVAGFNFKKLGYELSASTGIVFSCLMVLCFLTVPFLPKRNIIAIPKQVSKHRRAYVCIAVSSFMLMVVFGNRIEETYPNFFMVNSLESIDQTVFQHDNRTLYALDNVASAPVLNDRCHDVQSNESSNNVVYASFPIPNDEKVSDKEAKKLEKKELKALKRLQKHRFWAAAGITAGAVLLIILLGITTCAGVCLIIGGASNGGGVGYVLLGILVAGASIWGIVKTSQGGRRR